MKILDRNGVDRRYWKPVSAFQEAEICSRYEAGDKVAEIASDAGINLTSIYGVLERNGICARRNDGMPEAQQLEICRRYSAGESTYDLAREFGVSDGTIGKVLTQHGVQKRSASEVHRRYCCDHSFFDSVDSEAKAYWLGFIAADGNVYKNIVKIGLSARDRDHLLRFKADIKSDHPITDYTSTTGVSVSAVEISSPQIAEALAQHGVVPRKTFILDWPEDLDPGLLPHFLRGYSDGDGWFHVTKSPYVRKRDGGRREVLHWGIAGTERFCLAAQGFLMRETGVTKGDLSPHAKSPRIFRLSYGSTLQASRVYHLLYDDATVYLPRKRDIAEPHVRLVPAFTDGLVEVNRRRLRSLREERGFTLKSLAAKSGVDWSTILDLETGNRLTTSALAQRIATALGVPYVELRADPSEPNPPAEKNPAPLSPEQVREIRQRLADGVDDHRGLASEYGVGKSTIGRVVRKEGRWATIG
jgi:transcriptional regulator with XRE-family HTH domain